MSRINNHKSSPFTSELAKVAEYIDSVYRIETREIGFDELLNEMTKLHGLACRINKELLLSWNPIMEEMKPIRVEYHEDQTYVDPKTWDEKEITIPMYDPTSGQTVDVPLSAIQVRRGCDETGRTLLIGDEPRYWTKAEVIKVIDERLKKRNVQTMEYKGARDL